MGLGLPKDPAKAARWYRKAAEQGLPEAQYSLGQMYAEGRGVRKDLVEAHMWLSLSARAGFDAAHRALVALEHQLTADQIGLAEAMATAMARCPGSRGGRGRGRFAGSRSAKTKLSRSLMSRASAGRAGRAQLPPSGYCRWRAHRLAPIRPSAQPRSVDGAASSPVANR